MEEAKITPNGNGNPQKIVIPNLVTEDDLKHELGEWVVATMQKDKAIKLLGGQIRKQLEEMAKQKAEIDKLPAITRSNNQLDEKNRALAATLTEVRLERDAAVADKAIAVSSLAQSDKALVAGTAEVNRLQGLYDGSRETITSLETKLASAKKARKRKAA